MKLSHLFFLALAIASCKKRPCKAPRLSSIRISAGRAHFGDTSATIVKYNAGRNMSEVTDSFTNAFFIPTQTPLPFSAQLSMSFESAFDYKITFIPSGEQHTIEQIGLGNEKASGGLPWGGEEGTLFCSCSYVLDGEKIFIKEYYNDEGVSSMSYAVEIE